MKIGVLESDENSAVLEEKLAALLKEQKDRNDELVRLESLKKARDSANDKPILATVLGIAAMFGYHPKFKIAAPKPEKRVCINNNCSEISNIGANGICKKCRKLARK